MKITSAGTTILALLIFVLLTLIGRCLYLQHFVDTDYANLSVRQQQAMVIDNGKRGSILDCRGRVLAASRRIETVFAEPRVFKNNTHVKDAASALAAIIDMGGHVICKKILESKNPGYVKIKTQLTLTDEQRHKIRKIYGVGIESTWQRCYPLGEAAAHVLGFVGAENTGLGGVELKYDKLLGPAPGQSLFFADSARRPIGLKRQHSMAKDGMDLIVTVDSSVQQFAYAALLRQYDDYDAESAIAIVLEPASGAVLALVSLPGYDPEKISTASVDALRNRAITDPFEPGSIFKPVVAAWAVDTEIVKVDEKIFCENGNYSGKGFGRIGEYRQGFGKLTVGEILKVSSNIGMAKIGQKMGAESIYEGVRLFGFGQKTRIDLPAEELGLVWPTKRWTGYSVARVPFGHEISVTAMQIARAYCILANGGRAIKPHVVRAIVDTAGKNVRLQQIETTAEGVINLPTSQWIVNDALVSVVKDGTGKKAAQKKWQVFGKTGTANIAKSDSGGYDETNYVASFVGGAPAENPAIIVLVSIRRPDRSLGKGYTGGSVATPVAGEIIAKTLTYLEQ